MTERLMIAVPDSGLSLEGLFRKGERGAAVVAPPHPLYGGSLDNPVVEALAEGLARADIATLCFNFRGIGESSGLASASSRDADADYRAALLRLMSLHPGPYYAAGYSFGAAAAIRAARHDARISRLFLVAPPLAMLDLDALRHIPAPVVLSVGDDDEYTPRAELERTLAPFSNVQLHVLPGVDHFFSQGGLDELTQLTMQTAG